MHGAGRAGVRLVSSCLCAGSSVQRSERGGSASDGTHTACSRNTTGRRPARAPSGFYEAVAGRHRALLCCCVAGRAARAGEPVATGVVAATGALCRHRGRAAPSRPQQAIALTGVAEWRGLSGQRVAGDHAARTGAAARAKACWPRRSGAKGAVPARLRRHGRHRHDAESRRHPAGVARDGARAGRVQVVSALRQRACRVSTQQQVCNACTHSELRAP